MILTVTDLGHCARNLANRGPHVEVGEEVEGCFGP
jgi:hypothetical protein